MAKIEKNLSEYVVFAEFVIPGLGTITERKRIDSDKPEFKVPIMKRLNAFAAKELDDLDGVPASATILKFVAKGQKAFDKSKMVLITYELEGVE